MDIKVYADTICGWCYIGHAKLAKAIEHFKEIRFNLLHVPFQLNPDMPSEGINRIDYLRYKFGGEDIAQPMYDRMTEEASKAGLNFNLKKIQITPNTTKSHILINFAFSENKGLEILDEVFQSYFYKGIDIGNSDNLIGIAKKFNLDADKVKKLMSSKEEIEKVKLSDLEGRNKGINGVPFFEINNKTYISGAQSKENLIEAIKVNL
jgi:predicted DsbA family dithiol-disulfide isomerase